MDIKNINYEYFLDLSVRMTHHSNAIEGNTLTLNETATIIFDKVKELQEFEKKRMEQF